MTHIKQDKKFTGKQFLFWLCVSFLIILGANLALVYNALNVWPGRPLALENIHPNTDINSNPHIVKHNPS